MDSQNLGGRWLVLNTTKSCLISDDHAKQISWLAATVDHRRSDDNDASCVNSTEVPIDVQEAVSAASRQIGISLKPKQLEAIYKFCSGNDVSVSLPTGNGKLLLYGILSLIFDKSESNLAFHYHLSKRAFVILNTNHHPWICLHETYYWDPPDPSRAGCLYCKR